MRMLPSRYMSDARPARLKKVVSQVKHLQAPIKGLSINSKLVANDALTASVLDNWIVEKDRVSIRPGIKKLLTLTNQLPIEVLVPYYSGGANTLALASNLALYSMDGTLIRSGFGTSDWMWTSYSNLGERDYTLMVNGHDGVWSWDGGTVQDSPSVTVTSLSNANPAVVTVAAADIAKFSNDMWVRIVGADVNHAAANGVHQVALLNTAAHTFALAGVDTSAASGPQTTNVDAIPLGSTIQRSVTAPSGKPYINPSRFSIVLSHMNRVWFADDDHLAVYYLPLQQMTGEVKELPLNALFRRGGRIRAMYSWTRDGGAGMDDALVIFSSNGECVIYTGTDPDNDFNLAGIFRFDAPMSKRSIVNYGGDLHVLISTGFVAMSTLLQAEAEKLGSYDKNVSQLFWESTRHMEGIAGFGVILDYDSGWVICNLPTGAPNLYKQMVRFMPDPTWTSFSGIPSRSWQWLDSRIYLGSDDGCLYELSLDYLSDDGQPILADMQLTWSSYNTAAIKHFKMVCPYILTDGLPRPFIDLKVDYDLTLPFNQPDVSISLPGAEWDVATWDVDYWQQTPKIRTPWTGVAAIGRVGAPRVRVSVLDCHFSIAGFDILYETGAPVG